MNIYETKFFQGVIMSIIDNVFKKYDTKNSDIKSSLSVKIDTNLFRDINTVSNHLGISKSQPVADIIEISGISKKVDELKSSQNKS